ncbi:MAG: GH1 [uncultured Sphingomonadaceae bacterium]|uniref:GH1 n=1 Tax=uncultured Sphingomonadaceae bacterium TaxID=169976 RepID=A0A6J4S8L3_9SPHN|nr:MAG: GH1 [uncultured Sphingomonadaceae bacterium]
MSTESPFSFYGPRVVSHPSKSRFVFASGIECSYPVIQTPAGRVRRDQMAECGHYARWREDFELTLALGCRHLRYGPPYYSMHLAPGRYDWSFTDEVLPAMRDMGITPILDLCHFGVPDWIGDFQNADWPAHFAEYAGAFATRYPWIRLFTPVNEMYITAEFSGYYGWWNERLASHHGFVGALKNVTLASLAAMQAILLVRPNALFIHAESSEHTHANAPELVGEAEMFNERRFLTLDLITGRRISAGMYAYLRDNGMSEAEYARLRSVDLVEHFVIGHDYYVTNEHLLVAPGVRRGSGEVFGYATVARAYHERYRLPIMHTETNLNQGATGDEASDWLWKTWANVQQLRREGVPICGMTWYSVTDQVDWDVGLREKNDRVNPLGLYDLDRRLRPVGASFRRLTEQWRDTPLLPYGPFSIVGGLGAED